MGRTPNGQTRARVLAFVQQQLRQGNPPTVREVQHAMGFRSVGTARQHLDALVHSGDLVRASDGQHRALRLRDVDRTTTSTRLVPVLGRVQAGPWAEAVQDPDGHVAVDPHLAHPHPDAAELFALRVRGDSMQPELLAGDLVIVRRQNEAQNGELVVAMVDGEATIKRLRQHGHGAEARFELHASNPRYAPLVPDPAALTILGKVVELRRPYGAP